MYAFLLIGGFSVILYTVCVQFKCQFTTLFSYNFNYDYNYCTILINYRCDFHEECGSKYCSLGKVNVYTYVAAECLCPMFGIPLSSSHLPKLTVGGTVTSTKFKSRSGALAKDLDNDSDSASKCLFICLLGQETTLY